MGGSYSRQKREKIMKFREVDKNYWWVSASAEAKRDSALVPFSLSRKKGQFMDVRALVWHWYRTSVAGNVELSQTARFVGWALAERWRYETWSSHDAISYYAKMTGVNRKSVGKAVAELSEHNLIWIVLEGEPKRLKKSQSGGRKHFLVVGLASMVRE